MERGGMNQGVQEHAREPRPVIVHAGRVPLHGDLVLPDEAAGMVVFAHGSGSSRASPRNRMVARALQRVGLGTLLMDLLSEQEEEREQQGALLRFDVRLLAERLAAASEWLEREPGTRGIRIGYFGASTGAAAALIAAAARPEQVAAVVSRGGRPDLASADELARVRAPTLLLVGGRDLEVLELNRQAFEHLRCERKLEIIPNATHLFAESGALEQVAQRARDWFLRFLADSAVA